MTYVVEVWGQTPGGNEFVKRREIIARSEDEALETVLRLFGERFPNHKVCGGDVVKGEGGHRPKGWVTCR